MLKDDIRIKGLRNCPKCGHFAVMRKNASKRFEVYCPKCHSHSIWANKIDAVVDWYNKSALYERYNGEVTPEEE